MINCTWLNNSYYIPVTKTVSDLKSLEKECQSGVTRDGRTVYILKSGLLDMPSPIRQAFFNLKVLSFQQFQNLTLIDPQENINKDLENQRILTRDIWGTIKSYLDKSSLLCLALTSKYMLRIVGKVNFNDLGLAAARDGHLAILEWSEKNRFPLDIRLSSEAAERGHLDIVKWTHKRKHLWNEMALHWAANAGQINIMKWAYESRLNIDTIMGSAIYSGNFDLLVWLRSKGMPWPNNICPIAAKLGFLEILKWAKANGAPWNEGKVELYAREFKRKEILEWLGKT